MPAMAVAPLPPMRQDIAAVCHPADVPAVSGATALGERGRKIDEPAVTPNAGREPALASARQMAFASRWGVSPVRSITRQADRSATGPVAQAAYILAGAARRLGAVWPRRPDRPAADLPRFPGGRSGHDRDRVLPPGDFGRH